jgi:hypothetical protein
VWPAGTALSERLARLVDLEVRALQMLHDPLGQLPAGFVRRMLPQDAPQQLPALREREPIPNTSWLRNESIERGELRGLARNKNNAAARTCVHRRRRRARRHALQALLPGGHGEDGRGGAHTFMPHIGNLTKKDYIEFIPDGFLFTVIAEGGVAVGKNSYMPAWESTLSEQDIKDVIAHIRALPTY